MPKSKLYSIHDSKAKEFGQPFCATTPGLAERTFMDIMRNPGLPYGRYPDDHDLFEVGEMDSDTGIVTTVPVKLFVRGKQVVDKAPDPRDLKVAQ